MQLFSLLSIFLMGSTISCSVDAFSIAPHSQHLPSKDATVTRNRPTRLSPLFMGRAAAVRAATKSKTDAKKAKTNALYGKKV